MQEKRAIYNRMKEGRVVTAKLNFNNCYYIQEVLLFKKNVNILGFHLVKSKSSTMRLQISAERHQWSGIVAAPANENEDEEDEEEEEEEEEEDTISAGKQYELQIKSGDKVIVLDSRPAKYFTKETPRCRWAVRVGKLYATRGQFDGYYLHNSWKGQFDLINVSDVLSMMANGQEQIAAAI
tara:strand:- start:250 stop:792 length:543 start_codon:yes stop_codon:yes gene_type:complete